MGSRGDWPDMGEGLPILEIHPRFRAIIEDFVDPGLQFRGPLLDHFQSLQGVFQLGYISGSNEGGIEVVVLDGPGDGQMGQLAVEFFLGEVGKGLKTGDDFGLGESLVEDTFKELVSEVFVLVVEPIDFFLGDSLEMSAGKEAAGEGAPGDETILVVLIESEIFDLVFSSLEHVVFILGTNRLMEVQSLTGIQGIEDHLGIPVGSGPVEHLA
jgi:hypothetical protein